MLTYKRLRQSTHGKEWHKPRSCVKTQDQARQVETCCRQVSASAMILLRKDVGIRTIPRSRKQPAWLQCARYATLGTHSHPWPPARLAKRACTVRTAHPHVVLPALQAISTPVVAGSVDVRTIQIRLNLSSYHSLLRLSVPCTVHEVYCLDDA
jgi:hypothetical protein